MWWAPRRASWWTGVLFAAGSLCFAIGPFPGFVHLVGAVADASVFFAGSIAFTAAAALQFAGAGRYDRTSAAVQLAGTVLFNLSTWRALQDTLSNSATDRLVWRPDALGSVCFLIASYLAYNTVRRTPRKSPPWRIAAVNMAGSIAFGVSAVASYVVPSSGDVLDLAAANFTTVAGAVCFLAGAFLLLQDTGRNASRGPDRGISSRPARGTQAPPARSSRVPGTHS
jgi:hypothetical protein